MSSQHLSITGALEHHALIHPDRAAFVFVDKTLDRLVLTRQQVWDYCRKYAGVLKKKEIGRGDVVCNTLRNSPQRVIIDLGTIVAGAIAMNGQICFADGSDFVTSLNHGKATVVVLDPDDTKGAFAILKPRLQAYDPDTGLVSCPDVPSLKRILLYHLRTEKTSKNPLLEYLDGEDSMVHEELAPNDVCQYMCTSGSTNAFKVVAFNSQCIMEFGLRFGEAVTAREDDIYMNNRPLGWLGGYPSIYLCVGTCRVIFDESNGRPENYSECQWKMAFQEKCNICFSTPIALLEFCAAREASKDNDFRDYRLRCWLTGGGPVTRKSVIGALENLTQELAMCYASSESGTVSCLRVKESKDYEEFKTGCPVTGVKVKVVDGDGKEVERGQKGEILIQSTQAALYYVNDPENTSKTFQPDGWIRLGDLGYVNSQGQLSVIGRDKFAILRDAIVYYPYVIEGFLRGCPGLKDVVITGVPDEKWNEELCALVVRQNSDEASLTDEDVKRFCESGVANRDVVTPVPRYVLFVDSFPQSETGKLDRGSIKKLAREILHLEPIQLNTLK